MSQRSARALPRRGFLRLAAGAGLAMAAPGVLAGVARERRLALLNLHTGERLRTTYWADGRYVDDGLAEIARVLRDHRTGEVHPIDPALLDLLVALQVRTEASGAFHVISGYRSPRTNAALRAHSRGVARHSLHMQGRAIDIRHPRVRLPALRSAARSLRLGGVGYYPKSGFVHVDTGRVRYW